MLLRGSHEVHEDPDVLARQVLHIGIEVFLAGEVGVDQPGQARRVPGDRASQCETHPEIDEFRNTGADLVGRAIDETTDSRVEEGVGRTAECAEDRDDPQGALLKEPCELENDLTAHGVPEKNRSVDLVCVQVMREVVGDRTVDEVITIGRQEIESEALAKMQALSTKYAMGLSIDQVQLKNINPPEPVQESFNEVNQAQQEKEKLINEARRDYNKVIPLAEGEKDQRIREADGYRLKRINEAEGDVARFSALLAEYTKAPEVTRRRIYIETLQSVLPGIRSKIIIDEQTRGILPFLNLDSQTGERP